MRLDIQEICLLQNIAREQNIKIKIKIKIFGNIKVYSDLFEQDADKYVQIIFNNNTLERNFGILESLLKNRYGLSDNDIDNLSWLRYVFMNYTEVEIDNKIYKETTPFIEMLFEKALLYYKSSALNVVYRSRGKIYTGIYLKSEDSLYREYLVSEENKRLKKVLILADSISKVIKRVKDFTLLALIPNYETPNVNAFKHQMNKFVKETSVHYKIKRGD